MSDTVRFDLVRWASSVLIIIVMLTAGCTENGTDDEKGHIDIDVTVLKGAFDLEPWWV